MRSLVISIEYLDHLVLTVTDLERTCRFYSKVLGMQVVTFGENRKAIAFGQQKINLHQVGKELEPKADKPTAGSADLCFITQVALKYVIEHLRSCGIDLVEGPVIRTGASGVIESVYFRDPDLNLIEVSVYL
ncbi:MAG: VOC family protein [Elainellaceae cyanobacterium]